MIEEGRKSENHAGEDRINCYLDNAATTAVLPEVLNTMEKLFTEDYGNPSSLHKKGFEAERRLSGAKAALAQYLKCSEKELIFTSGGTESDNMAIIGAALKHQRLGRHIISTAIEHPAVSAPLDYLKEQGYEVEKLSVDSDGLIDLNELESKLRADTILVSIMHVNNEIGTIEPVEKAGELIKKKNPACLFHVDDIQGFGKLPLIPSRSHIDLLSASAHKLHGPKGVGLLYKSKDVLISPIIFGGGQQNGLRSGTENVPGIAGFAEAIKLLNSEYREKLLGLSELRDFFVRGLSGINGTKVNGPSEKIAPHIVSLSVYGVRSEVLLHALENKGIYVSSGSACSSNKPAVSPTLKAIGAPKEALDSTIRFSFSIHTKKSDLEYALKTLHELIPELRRFVRK